MRAVRISVILFTLIAFSACRKSQDKVYSVTGRLLESSGNPVPVKGYSLSLYQKGSYGGIMIGYSSATATTTTDSEGYFNFNYAPGNGFFIAIPATNRSPLSISTDYSNSNPFQIFWSNIPALKDTSLQNVFLFKVVKASIIKVQSTTPILPSDTINITAETKTGYYKKNIAGVSIPANTEKAVDTIKDVIFTNFDFYLKKYVASINVGKNRSYYYNYQNNEPPLDEAEKTYKFTVF